MLANSAAAAGSCGRPQPSWAVTFTTTRLLTNNILDVCFWFLHLQSYWIAVSGLGRPHLISFLAVGRRLHLLKCRSHDDTFAVITSVRRSLLLFLCRAGIGSISAWTTKVTHKAVYDLSSNLQERTPAETWKRYSYNCAASLPVVGFTLLSLLQFQTSLSCWCLLL